MNGVAIPRSAVELLHEQLPVHDLPKALTGIRGLDEVTRGGLPKGRPTLVCGGPGSGKTLLALTFLVNGAARFDEPGVLLTFEENAEEIASDVASLGFDLPHEARRGRREPMFKVMPAHGRGADEIHRGRHWRRRPGWVRNENGAPGGAPLLCGGSIRRP